MRSRISTQVAAIFAAVERLKSTRAEDTAEGRAQAGGLAPVPAFAAFATAEAEEAAAEEARQSLALGGGSAAAALAAAARILWWRKAFRDEVF